METKAIQCIREGNKSVKQQLYDEGKLATAVNKWNTKYINLEWDRIFLKCRKTTSDVKLRWFQARLIHRILPTNVYLFLCKIKESPLCTFCNAENESITHLFWECPVVAQLWKRLEKLLQEKCLTCTQLKLSEQLVIFGYEKNVIIDKAIYYIITLGKFFIYKCKLKNICPSIEGLVHYLNICYSDEQFISRTYLYQDIFETKWLPYKALFSK